jgi:diguanylate cyclase (GGDEF)-like protein
VPVFLDGRVVGGLNVESGMERQLGEWDLALIELFSQQVSVALANVSQYEQAVERASIDPVSQLPNHGALMERLSLAVRDAQRRGAPLAALFIDLDKFKRFNDAFGHRVGDQVLYAVGRYLERQLPVGAYVARYGGEEFVALLTETTINEAQRVAETIRAQLALAPLDIAPRERFPVTVSIGVAGIDNAFSPITTAEELLDAADQAMYEAKRLGRNRVVRWAPAVSYQPSAIGNT